MMNTTITNLMKAFAGESQARNRYTMYASVARKEGYEQIAAIFLETADQEREHASILYKFLNELKKKGHDVNIPIETEVPVAYGTTIENLKAAIAGESYERDTMYVEFAAAALKEGFKDIGIKFKIIINAEAHHAERYTALLKQLEENTYFNKEDSATEWKCRECGYVHTGNEPPDECPLCGHAKSFYEKKQEEY